jgi:hypothetical protein
VSGCEGDRTTELSWCSCTSVPEKSAFYKLYIAVMEYGRALMSVFNWDWCNPDEHWRLFGKQNAHLAARTSIFNKTARYLVA